MSRCGDGQIKEGVLGGANTARRWAQWMDYGEAVLPGSLLPPGRRMLLHFSWGLPMDCDVVPLMELGGALGGDQDADECTHRKEKHERRKRGESSERG